MHRRPTSRSPGQSLPTWTRWRRCSTPTAGSTDRPPTCRARGSGCASGCASANRRCWWRGAMARWPASSSCTRCIPRCAWRGRGSSTTSTSTPPRAARAWPARCWTPPPSSRTKTAPPASRWKPPSTTPPPARCTAARAGRKTRRSGTRGPSAERPGVVMLPQDPRLEARRAVQREPQRALARILLSDADAHAGDAPAGASAAQRALRLAPGHPEALARLGRAHWMLADLRAAAASRRAASNNAPQRPGIAVWLGHVLEDIGEAEAASEAYARAHLLAPGNPLVAAYLLAWRRRLCDWRDVDRLSHQVRESVRRAQASVEPFASLSEDASAAEQLQCARLRAAPIAAAIRPLPPAPPPADGELQIGFLSNGFGAHPTGLLVVAFLEALAAHAGIRAQLFALNPDDGSDI